MPKQRGREREGEAQEVVVAVMHHQLCAFLRGAVVQHRSSRLDPWKTRPNQRGGIEEAHSKPDT